MILDIDVTVTGPDQVLTGSVAVTVNPAPAAAPVAPVQAPVQAPMAGELANLRMRQRSEALRALRWGPG